MLKRALNKEERERSDSPKQNRYESSKGDNFINIVFAPKQN